MTYRVDWSPDAEDQLANIRVNATDQLAVTRAGDRIDTLLGVMPGRVGESRSPGVRVVFEPPLAAIYEIIEDDKVVRILRVRDFWF